MQTTVNILEQYELKEAGRQEAKSAAIAALQEHLGRLNDRSRFSDFENPYHKGARNELEFAITLVRISI
jgi:hypothetical protein